MDTRIPFACDYMEGAHPIVMQRLMETNLMKTDVYGADHFSESAKAKIREACEAPDADVWFFVGGTQTNATVIDSLLLPYQGVLSAVTGHISIHEAGAVERGGHRVIMLPQKSGKISAASILKAVETWRCDGNRAHVVMPGMVYISQPTEFGTLYSLRELTEISKTCHENGLLLYLDGARLAYAFACEENDVWLPDLARLCDVFYIGGTKCGTLLGEAVVFPKHDLVPNFFSIMKQHGAVLAKGRIAGIQFDTMFTDGLYMKICRPAIEAAKKIRTALTERGYTLAIDSPTNQIFISMTKEQIDALSENVQISYMEEIDETHTMMRICTGWSTTEEDVEKLIALL